MKQLMNNDTPFLINLPQPFPGLERFIGAWVIPAPVTIVVDVGPKSSIPRLIQALRDRGLERIDYVFLSHIHIDHAGGLGPFLAEFPLAQAVCHAQGRKHLLDPGKLWEGSLKTLEDMALAYGPIDPVPEDRLIGHADFSLPGLTILETPGHAPHHLSFDYQGKLFAGEGAGIYLPFWDGLYLRPPTPPRFFFDQAVASVDQMLSMEDRPIYFAHLGAFPHSREILKDYRQQLYRWLDCTRQALESHPADPLKAAAETLLSQDPCLKNFRFMDKGSQQRERTFMQNSLAGFAGYLGNPELFRLDKNSRHEPMIG
jgi:glyoxylase-like metal-dependent hydrolase (beta-lactamase superfamily II)